MNKFLSELTSEQKRTFIEWLKDIWNKIFGKNKAPKELRHIEKLFGKALTEVKDRLVKQGEHPVETAVEDATFSSESDVQSLISEKKNIDYYTEKSYTDFGWVRYNDVLSATEWKSITSNYAAYKHSKDKYVTTRFGEAIIHSQDYPNVLAYMTGPIKYPKVVKIVRINTFNSQEIVTEIRTNERNQIPLPYESIRNFYGDEILTISKARDYDDFWSIKGKAKGKDGQRSDTIGGEQQDGGRGSRSGEETGRTSESGAVTEEVQYSISEKSSDGQKLTKEQSRFFRNSKVRDEKGRLLAVYHGTKRAGFTTLNKNKRSFAKKRSFFNLKNKVCFGVYRGVYRTQKLKKVQFFRV